jgi:biopolymer transport protein ExbD
MGSGIVIRLIDVVLILLFGFISISEVSQKTQISLPKSTEVPLSNPDKEEILIIGITTDGEYLVDEESRKIVDVRILENYIWDKQMAYIALEAKMRVRIRSDRDAPAKYTMRLARLCDQLNIPKSIDVEHRRIKPQRGE